MTQHDGDVQTLNISSQKHVSIGSHTNIKLRCNKYFERFVFYIMAQLLDLQTCNLSTYLNCKLSSFQDTEDNKFMWLSGCQLVL